MKKSRGITLIALVITIIVLLILAGVSISAITGENGLVEKAKNAKDATRVAQIEEKIKLYQSENSLLAAGNETIKTIEEFVDELEKEGTITSKEKTEILENHTLTIGNQEPIVFPFAKTLVQAFKDGEIKVGDYIDYTPSDLDSTVELTSEDVGDIWLDSQIYSVDENVTWRVLGLNKDKTELLITTGSPIKKDGNDPYLNLQGIEGYYNSINTLNKISKIYHNEELASETRSMTVEDINELLGIVVEDNIVYKNGDETKTNIDIAESLGKTYTYKIGDYAPENYLKAYYPNNEEYQKLDSKKSGDVIYANAYTYSYVNSNIIDPNSDLYDVLFSGTTEEENYAKCYWLATKMLDTYSSSLIYSFSNFGVGCVSYNRITNEVLCDEGYGYDKGMAVRPIVSLKASMTIEDIPLISGSEEVWNTTTYNKYEHAMWDIGEVGKILE